MNCLVLWRDRFFDFDLGHVTEAGKDENCRFLENCSMEFAENQQKKSVFNILSAQVMKNFKIGSENFRIFFSTLHVQIGKIFKKSIFSNFDFRGFDILSLKSIEKWPRSLIFIQIRRAVFEKPTIFDFTGFCHVTMVEIEKSVPTKL